ncbi:hypothetical protein [Beijerinckia indica]|nr:hypothetical protein [Beijerinckia indica]
MADQFVDSVGVNAHFDFYNSPYYLHFKDIIIPAFKSSGIRHVRFAAFNTPTAATTNVATLISTLRSYNGTRIGLDLVEFPSTCPLTNDIRTSGNLSWVSYTNIDYFEGLNEYNGSNNPCGGNWYDNDRSFQKALWNKVQYDKSGVAVLGPSLYGTLSTYASQIGNLYSPQYETYGNDHSYPYNGGPPSNNIHGYQTGQAVMNGSLPFVTSETGYPTDPGLVNNSSISYRAHGKYFSRLWFEYFNAGSVRTFSYELIDDPVAAGPVSEQHLGLLDQHGNPKPGFTAISNEIALLKDPGHNFTPGALNYTLINAPSQVHHTLLQKRDGRFYLALWQEVASFKQQCCDITNSSVAVTVKFANTMNTVNQYNPIASATAFATSRTVSSLTVSVPDQAIILEIIP